MALILLQNMKFFTILYIVFKFCNCSNIIRLPDINEATFELLEDSNKRHVEAPFETVTVETEYDCADTCLYNDRCKSFNIDKRIEKNWKCELIDKDRNDYENATASIVDANGFEHFDTGFTRLTHIVNHAMTSCLMPKNRGCEIDEGVGELVTVENNIQICNTNRAAYFSFNRYLGRLVHHCSGKMVCKDPHAPNMVISSGCPNADIRHFYHTFRVDFRK